MNITLKTLPEATAQQVFDQVANHLLTQNAKSLFGNWECAYRGEGGLKCAAGCLIGDDEYRAAIFESKSWWGLLQKQKVPKEHFNLICSLQAVHDTFNPENWREQLRNVAADFNLQCDVLN